MARLAYIFLLIGLGLLSTVTPVSAETLPPIIFVKQTPVAFTGATIADIFNNVVGKHPLRSQPLGGGLFRLDPDGTLTNLTPFEHIAVRDPEISYDGTKVIFSMKRGANSTWQIHEINVDGTNLRRISAPNINDWDPNYLPDGRIVFVSDRLDGVARINENLPQDYLPEGKMFIMNADGTNIRLINANPHGSFNPFLSSSGQIVYTQWDLNDLRASPDDPADGISYSRFLIWETMIDGSREGHPIFGSHRIQDFAGGFTEAREIEDANGDMIATLTQTHQTWGAGSIVRFSPRGNPDQESFTWLTPEESYAQLEDNTSGRYRSPYPLADGRIIASYAPGTVWDAGSREAPDFDLVLLNDNGSHQIIHADPDFWDWQAVEVRAREAPQIAQPHTFPEFNGYAIVNTMDIELRNRNAQTVPNGDFQPEIQPRQAAAVAVYMLGRPPAPYAGGDPEDQDLQRMYLGTVPIEPDGSFAAIVPARTMIIWDVVDAEGNTLVAERVWSEFAPGEIRTCGGCHTPPDSSGRASNMALMNPVNLTTLNVDLNNNGQVDLIEAYLKSQ